MIILLNFKRILKNKVNLFFMVIFPTILIMLIMLLSFSKNQFRVGIVDEDNTKFTHIIKNEISKKANIILLDKDSIKERLIETTIDYIVIFDKGTTDKIITKKQANIEAYFVEGNTSYMSIKGYIESLLDSSLKISKISNTQGQFYNNLEKYLNGSISLESKTHNSSKKGVDRLLAALGFIVMSMLFLAANSTQLLLIDKFKKTTLRIFVSPISFKNFIIQNIISWYLILVIQVFLLFSLIYFIFFKEIGISLIKVNIVFLIFAFTSVSLGMFMTNISKDPRQAGILSSIIITPLCMLGGCYWPLEFMPSFLQKAAKFIPTSWIIKACKDALFGVNSSIFLKDIFIIILFSIFFLLISFKKKSDMI
ncbi:ABC transporter permease [Caldicellulosiruptoraceae bacterium PP1]